MKKQTTKKPTKTKKYLTIILIAIIIVALIISSPAIYTAMNNAKADEEKTLEVLKTQKIEKELEKDKEFKSDGFSQKYYELKDELNDLNIKVNTLEASITFKYTFLPIIIIALVVVVGGFSLVISIIVKDFQKMTPNLKQIQLRIQPADPRTILNRYEPERPTKLKPLKCPSCKANLEHGAVKCEYCGTSVVKEKK